jgi:hypothetical protein
MENKWNLDRYVYSSKISIDDMVNSIRVFELLKNKYPNDELIDGAIEVLRDEVCKMFGGTIYNDED